MNKDYIYFYLPGVATTFEINFILNNRMHEHPDHFYDNIKIGAIFGTIPGAIWNGGRVDQGIVYDDDLNKIKTFHDITKIPLRWTWTNPTIVEEDLEDQYCNNLTRSFENGLNEILVNNDLMENYFREHFPKYPLISSTTKRITSIDDLNKELEKDYKLVVIDYDFNNDWEKLDKIQHPEKCEILVNAICNPKCPFRKKHYQLIGENQKTKRRKWDKEVDECPAQFRHMHEVQELPTFVSREDLYGKYFDAGFRHFKIEGRCVFPITVIEWYLYYMVKPEYQMEEREWLQQGLKAYVLSPNIRVEPVYPIEENS